MRVSILLYKVSNIKLFLFFLFLDLALQGFTTFKKNSLQGAGGCIGDQQFAQQEDSAEASKHQSYQVEIITTEHHGSWLFQNQKLIMVWVGGDCGIAHTQRIVH